MNGRDDGARPSALPADFPRLCPLPVSPDDWEGDLETLFASSEISTIFLDRNLVIRSFTPAAAQLFGLVRTDTGHPLADFGHLLNYPQLGADLLRVVETGKPVECRVDTLPHPAREAQVYLARHLPYRAHSKDVEGVFATFVDITRLAGAEKRLQAMVSALKHRVNNMFTMVIALANQTAAEHPAKDRFLPVYQDRLLGLARVFALLARKEMTGVDLRDLIQNELVARGFDKLPQRIDGQPLLLDARTALPFGMVLTELGGHLERRREAGAGDELDITWSAGPDAGESGARRLRFTWRTRQNAERGAEAVTPPSEELIAQEIRHGLDGDVEMVTGNGTLQVALSFPLPETP